VLLFTLISITEKKLLGILARLIFVTPTLEKEKTTTIMEIPSVIDALTDNEIILVLTHHMLAGLWMVTLYMVDISLIGGTTTVSKLILMAARVTNTMSTAIIIMRIKSKSTLEETPGPNTELVRPFAGRAISAKFLISGKIMEHKSTTTDHLLLEANTILQTQMIMST